MLHDGPLVGRCRRRPRRGLLVIGLRCVGLAIFRCVGLLVFGLRVVLALLGVGLLAIARRGGRRLLFDDLRDGGLQAEVLDSLFLASWNSCLSLMRSFK